MGSWDASRISAAIPSGVGFLGAGLIFKKTEEDSTMVVHGLTTAASVWLSAAVGIACGGELYFAGSFGTALMLLLRFGPRGSDVEEDDEDEDFDYEMNDGEDDDEEENIDSGKSIRSMKSRSTMGHIEIGTEKRSQAAPPPPTRSPRSTQRGGTTRIVPTKDQETTKPTTTATATATAQHHRRDTP